MIDINSLTTEELREIADAIARTLEQRARVEEARAAVHTAVDAYASAAGISTEAAWLALCPLPAEAEPAPPPVSAPAWKQPAGAHDAYKLGSVVTYRGAVYESVLAGNAFSPAAYPQGWRKL